MRPSPVRSLSVVLPAFNEEDALPLAVQGWVDALPSHVPDWEIVVADDGSTDGTPSVCEALSRQLGDRFRCVRLTPNQGYGAALTAGIAAARSDWILLTDSDGQFDPAQTGLLVAEASRSPLVVGFRRTRAEGRRRQFTSAVFNIGARMLFDLRVRDIDCAFKLFDAGMLKSVQLTCRRYLVNTEILHAFVGAGWTPVEVGVEHRDRVGGISKISFRDVPRSLWEMAKLRVRLWRRPRPALAPPVHAPC